MSTAALPLRVCVPVAEAVVMMSYAGEGIPGEYYIPIYDPGHWSIVTQRAREGDEITIVAEIDGQPVIEVPAVVVTLIPSGRGEFPVIEVIA